MLALVWMVLSLFLGITMPLPPVVVDPPPPEPTPVVVTPSDTPVRVVAGTSERIRLGVGNPSIGDGYALADGGDATTVIARVESENTNPGCEPGGCTYDYFLVLNGVRPGTTSVTTQYCFRSAPPSCDDKGVAAVTWTVKVTKQ